MWACCRFLHAYMPRMAHAYDVKDCNMLVVLEWLRALHLVDCSDDLTMWLSLVSMVTSCAVVVIRSQNLKLSCLSVEVSVQ
jgi:hypothetical protein